MIAKENCDDGDDSVPTPRQPDDGTTGDNNGTDLVEEVTALKSVLNEALARTNKVLLMLRKQHKQARLLQATLSSLRRLPQTG